MDVTKLLSQLRDPDWRGPAQHLRGWDELNRLHDAAANEIERLSQELERHRRREQDAKVMPDSIMYVGL